MWLMFVSGKWEEIDASMIHTVQHKQAYKDIRYFYYKPRAP